METVLDAGLEEEQRRRAERLAERLLAEPDLARAVRGRDGGVMQPMTPEIAREIAWSMVARGLDDPGSYRDDLMASVFAPPTGDDMLDAAEPSPYVAPLDHIAFHLRLAMWTTQHLVGDVAFERRVAPRFRKAVEALSAALVGDADELPKKERSGIAELLTRHLAPIADRVAAGELDSVVVRLGELLGVEAPPRDRQGRVITDPAVADETRRERAAQRRKRASRKTAKAASGATTSRERSSRKSR